MFYDVIDLLLVSFFGFIIKEIFIVIENKLKRQEV